MTRLEEIQELKQMWFKQQLVIEKKRKQLEDLKELKV